ncbi:hypothetical protein GE061_003519 [Apolygus lucorum]|uniref:Programmed cell death protein 5 n=1 Tax=Apolygus lucorum TaxID=248454 RepID=A0A6A4J3M6_APOLU|nr:hypothetical protein GE061_003519 [Apolygus lucorum]
MDDAELEQIRAKRLAELQGGRGGFPQGQQYNAGDNKAMEEKKKQQEDMKNGILAQILDQNARARLNTLLVGKPEKGKMIENMLVSMAQRGQIMGKMDEDELIGILEKISEQTHKETKVKFDRRRAAMDSDDDLDV